VVKVTQGDGRLERHMMLPKIITKITDDKQVTCEGAVEKKLGKCMNRYFVEKTKWERVGWGVWWGGGGAGGGFVKSHFWIQGSTYLERKNKSVRFEYESRQHKRSTQEDCWNSGGIEGRRKGWDKKLLGIFHARSSRKRPKRVAEIQMKGRRYNMQRGRTTYFRRTTESQQCMRENEKTR